MRILIFVLGIFIVMGLGFGYWSYFFEYSNGYREGLLNKFSTKGVVFKTNEGELLMPGVVPNIPQMSNNYFYFSCLDPHVVSILNNATGRRVKLHYVQYNNTLPWRGDNYRGRNKEDGQYIVDQAEVAKP